MKTYQDWLKVADKSDKERMEFVFGAIEDYKNSDEYKFAVTAQTYYDGKNEVIEHFKKMLYNAFGEAVPDMVSANHKIAEGFFKRDVVQATSTLLSNGLTWNKDLGGKTLGKSFDRKISQLHRWAQIAGVSWGFFNKDHVDTFKATEFFGLKDEEDGMVKTGIRFWQLDSTKPLRAVLYEMDGYTGYIRKSGEKPSVYSEKRDYIEIKNTTVADGEEIAGGENYPSFPVVPLYVNEQHQSELVGLKNTIDAIDLIQSGYCNDSDANFIFWLVTNAGGMDDMDLVEMVDKLKKVHAAQLAGDQQIQMQTVEQPYLSREAILDRLEKKLYKDAMALNTYDLASGAVTATEIIAAYEPLNEKLDLHEEQLSEFIERLLIVANIEDEATYTRSLIINQSEMIDNYINSAPYLDDEYVTEKIMTVLGDKDQVKTVLDRRAKKDLQRLTGGNADGGINGNTEGEQTV
jgi:hypothetical protein